MTDAQATYRVIAIETDDDGYVCQDGREISAPVGKYGNHPLFKLRHQKFVPLQDVKLALAAHERAVWEVVFKVVELCEQNMADSGQAAHSP